MTLNLQQDIYARRNNGRFKRNKIYDRIDIICNYYYVVVILNMSEEAIHIAIADYLNIALDSRSFWMTIEVSNQQGGYAGFAKQKKLRRKGVKKGTPDIFIWQDGRILWLEVKSKTGTITDNQDYMHHRLQSLGHMVEIVRSVEDAQEALKKHEFDYRHCVV